MITADLFHEESIATRIDKQVDGMTGPEPQRQLSEVLARVRLLIPQSLYSDLETAIGGTNCAVLQCAFRLGYATASEPARWFFEQTDYEPTPAVEQEG